MGMAALQAGAHVYMEKPFATTLAEADELLDRLRTSYSLVRKSLTKKLQATLPAWT